MKDFYNVGDIDFPLTPIVQMHPIYPMMAKRQGMEGWVKVRFLVTETGRVEKVSILDAENMHKKALSLAGQLTETYPLEPKWWNALAHIHLSEDHYREALAAMTIYGYLQPYGEKEKELMAELSLMAGIPAKAVSYYESLQAQSSESRIIVKIIQSYQMMNEPLKALKWAEKGLLQTKSSELMMQKATFLYELRQFDQSI